MPASTPRHADPDFVPSLRLLVERERYSITDIALMFGVSRERVRQWCARHGIDNPNGWRVGLNCIRMWDDDANCFVAVPISDLRRVEAERRRISRKAALAARRAKRRESAIAAVRALYEKLGRELTAVEMAEAIYRHPVPQKSAMPLIGGAMGLDEQGKYRPGSIRELREAVGMERRPAGARGHLTENERRLSPGGDSQTAFTT